MKEKDYILTFEFNPHNVLFLVNKNEDAFQIYENGKYIDTWYIDPISVADEIRRAIYFHYRKGYNTKVLGYGHEFDDEEDFQAETWTLAWAVASWIEPSFWTVLTTPHASGLWTKFILPKAIVDNDELKMVRWLNYYFTTNKKSK